MNRNDRAPPELPIVFPSSRTARTSARGVSSRQFPGRADSRLRKPRTIGGTILVFRGPGVNQRVGRRSDRLGVHHEPPLVLVTVPGAAARDQRQPPRAVSAGEGGPRPADGLT